MPNDYDRVSKEVFNSFLPDLLARHDERKFEILGTPNTELSGTYHFIVDYLLHVRDVEGMEKILHFEVQTHYDPKMNERVAVYNALLQQKFGLPVESTVMYLGHTPENVENILPEERVFTGYGCLELRKIPIEFFLKSPNLDTVALGILSDFGVWEARTAVKKLIAKIREESRNGWEAKQQIQRLMIFSRIIGLEEYINEEVKDMPIILELDETKAHSDPFFKMGVKEGEKSGELKLMIRMVRMNKIHQVEAADILGMPTTEFMGYMMGRA